MYGSSLYGSGESRAERHARDLRYSESPRATVAGSVYGASGVMSAVPAYAQHSRNNSSSGVGRTSVLRMALHGGVGPRWSTSSETITEEMQRRRGKLTEGASARRYNDSGTTSRDYQAPNQPYDPSPATRPLSVRQRQAGLSRFPPSSELSSMFPARRRASAFRDDSSERWRASDAGAEIGPNPVRGGARSSVQCKAAALSGYEVNKSGRGGFTGTCGGCGSTSNKGNNQTEEEGFRERTLAGFGSSSNVPTRAASPPSSSLCPETGLQRHGHVVRRGRCGGTFECERADSGTPTRASGGLGATKDGSRSSGTFDEESLRGGGSGGGCVRPSAPSTAPSACDIERLPSIEGQEEVARGDYPSVAVRRRRYQTPGSSDHRHPTTSEERYRRGGCCSDENTSDKKSNRRNASSEHKTAGAGGGGSGRPGAELVSGERKKSDGSHGLDRGHSVNASISAAQTRGSGSSSEVEAVSSFSVHRECLVGLQNLGNTCFMNACLQCLLHTDALVDLFRRRVHEQRIFRKSRTQGALAAAFGELVRLTEASPAYSNVSPTQIKRLVGKYAPHLSGYRQQDCQEFLRFFLDGLSEDLNRWDSEAAAAAAAAAGTHHNQQASSEARRHSASPTRPPSLSEEALATLSADQQADRAWALHLGRNDSEVTRMFCGQLHSRISCLACGNVSHCFDPFFDLSLPLPREKDGVSTGEGGRKDGDLGNGFSGRGSGGGFSAGLENNTPSSVAAAAAAEDAARSSPASRCNLEDCLRAFTAKETLDGDNRPVCARCRRRRKSAKCLAVHRFPPILVIHLKRFHYDSTSRQKLGTSVDFPIATRLNLAPFTSSWVLPSSAGDLPLHQEPKGVGVRHREDTSRSGRPQLSAASVSPMYELYAVCNHTGGLEGGHYTAHCRSQEWHTFDDSRVCGVHSGQVGGASAYVLFYRLIVAR